jgi:hypothetical protein
MIAPSYIIIHFTYVYDHDEEIVFKRVKNSTPPSAAKWYRAGFAIS